jgi:hypothetical protein
MFWQPKDFTPFSSYLIFAPLILCFFFPYIQSEIQTNANSYEFDQVQYCRSDKNPDFKKLKIIYIEKHKSIAKLYCLYNNTNKNYSVNLYYTDQKWFVEQNRNLSDGFYWPIYY